MYGKLGRRIKIFFESYEGIDIASIRLALNYKNLPFKTVWLNFVNIKPTLQRIGAEPSPCPPEPEGVLYTVPVLVDTSASGPPAVITGILAIAEYLDDSYPERPIFPKDSRALLTFYHDYLVQHILFSMVPIILGAVPQHIPECDQAYFRETRERWLNTKLEELSPPGPNREKQMEKLKGELDSLAKILAINGDGKELIMDDYP